MYKKCTAAAVAVSVIASFAPQMAFAAGEDVQENYSVSGYISVESGKFLAGTDRSITIYVDQNDYDGVIRAVGDLASDIESVTGVRPAIAGADTAEVAEKIETDHAYISNVDTVNGIMTIANSGMLSGEARGYVASYNDDGTLLAVSSTNETAKAGVETLTFDPVESKNIKGFLWEESDGVTSMKPATDSYTTSSGEETDSDIIIGTIGESDAIDSLIAEGKLDVSDIEGKWECFTIKDVDGKTVVAGSDKRGTIYGIYDISEKIGVSPWYWWADAKPVHSDNLYINLPEEGYTEGEPSIKYRGIFLNDEYNLNQWSYPIGDENMNNEKYNKIFELLLRLKANYLWPAMHEYSTAFNMIENNAKNADIYGIVMGSSHCEMLLRNNVGEWETFYNDWKAANPDKPLKGNDSESAYDYTDEGGVYNKQMLLDYWRERVRENGAYENTYTIGMRGVHDGSWNPSAASTTSEKVELLSEIMTEQRKILQEEIGKPIEEIPQVFIPYKEINDIYNAGLEVPDEVTLMWTDDNFGYLRQTSTDEERERSGGAGIYYHISYYGRPISYLWLTTTQPGLMREELVKAYDTGADRIWVLNVGDIKPAETQIDYFTKLARDVEGMRDKDINEVLAENAQRDFNLSDEDAMEYADIQTRFYELANSRRPEFMRKDTISLTANGDEASKYIDELSSLTERSEELYNNLPEEKQPSFFEMQLYPLRSVKNISVTYLQADRSDMYVEEGRGAAANKYAAESEAAAAEIDADTSYYNSMLDGKWNKIMNLKPDKLASLNAHINTAPGVSTVSALDYTEMGIAVDLQTDINAQPELSMSKFDTEYKYIDIFNKGYGSFDWEITADKDYIIFNKESGTVNDDYRLYTGVDWSKAPGGTSSAVITVKQLLGDTVVSEKTIDVTLSNPDVALDEKSYIETNGVVSIEAEHFTNSVSNGEYNWQIEEDFGRSGDSVKIYPNLADSVADPNMNNSAYLEYKVYFENSGQYTVDAYRMPTLNELGTVRFAIGIDESAPSLYKGNNKFYDKSEGTDAWGKGVLCNSEKLTGTINVSEPGYHTIRLYNSDPGIVIDKIVISKNAQPDSYFGVPETYNSTYNNVTPQMPEAQAATETTGNISRKFEPKVVVSDVKDTELTLVKTADCDTASVISLSYNSDGTMAGADVATVDMSGADIGDAVTVPINTDRSKAYAVVAVDNFDTMNPISQICENGTIVTEGTENTVAVKTDLNDYAGKKGVVVIADSEINGDITAENIKYVRYEELTPYSFKEIPFAQSEGTYNIRIGVDGNVFDETINTAKNTEPDNNGVASEVESWNFDNGLTGTNGTEFTLGGSGTITDGKAVLYTSSGPAEVTFDEPVTGVQGESLTVEFDINFGKQDKKSMDYAISDSNGTALVSASINAYITSNSSVSVNGENLIDDFTAFSSAISNSSTSSASNKPTHFKHVFDFENQRVYITISYEGGGSVTYNSRIPVTASGDIKSMRFSSSHQYEDRACLLDNVVINKESGPQYKMIFTAFDKDTQSSIDNASVEVYDAVYNKQMTSEADGSYMLCEGEYTVKATADGYLPFEETISVAPWIESKEIKLNMVSSSSLEPAQLTVNFTDTEGNPVKESVVLSDNVFVGTDVELSDEYFSSVKSVSDGVTKVYECVTDKDSVSPVMMESANEEINIVYELKGTYLFYEDFENYNEDEAVWTSPSKVYPSLIKDNDNSYLKFTSNGKTIGTYTEFDAIDGNGGTFSVEADVKFAPTGTAGNSQFAISSSAPGFDSNNVDYGITSTSERKSGHIIAFEYNAGSELLLNGVKLPSSFVNTWLHMAATVNFADNTVSITVTNELGETETVEEAFYSDSFSNADFGSYYIRAAKTTGTVSVDNISIANAQ